MSLWNCKKSGWANSSLAAFLIIAVIISICSTGIRTKFKVISPDFSYHNELYPEIGVFNFFLFCSALFGFISVALRYSYIMDQVQVMPTAINYVNKISVSTGIISFLALIFIASFSISLKEMVISFQSTAAYLFIGLGVIFTVLQTVLTYTSSRISIIFVLRLCLSLVLMSTFISSIVFTEKSKENLIKNDFPSDNGTMRSLQNNRTENERSEKEMTLLTACVLEWISVTVYALFFLSFFREFQTISAYVIMRPFITTSSNDFRSSSLTVNERI